MSLVGENIDAHCLKCKLVLAHIVMYEVGGVVNKVKCKTCGAEHKYRGVNPPAKKGDPALGTLREKKLKAEAVAKNLNSQAPKLWEAKYQNLDPQTPVRDYAIHDRYKVHDVIRHPVFGVGFVERIFSDSRMDVLFQNAIRSMAMNIG